MAALVSKILGQRVAAAWSGEDASMAGGPTGAPSARPPKALTKARDKKHIDRSAPQHKLPPPPGGLLPGFQNIVGISIS